MDHGTFSKNGRTVEAANAEHAVHLQSRGYRRQIPQPEPEPVQVWTEPDDVEQEFTSFDTHPESE